jgi:hypothetical protein
MASLNDQFEHGRIPIKPLPYKDRNLSQCNEIMVDYGENANYHIYITHHNDPDKYIDITALIVKEMLPEVEINANQFTITIEGERDPQSLMDIINYIWKRFTHAEDPSGFVPEVDMDKVYDPTTVSVLLQTTDGQIQLPITLADNVYDKNGNSIQSTLDNMTRLGFSVSYIYSTQDNQTSFEFNYPFEDYSDMLEVRIGTTYVDNTRYQITKHYNAEGHYTSATLDFIGESIEIGRRIDLIWIFNSAYQDGGRVQFISGSKIADSTISISKLEKYSDSYNYADGNSVATSKGLTKLYNDLTETINANNQNLFNYPDTSTSSTDIRISTDIRPKDGDVVVVTTASTKLSTATLLFSIKNSTSGGVATTNPTIMYNIKTPDGNSLTKGFANNQVLKFKLDGLNAILLSGFGGEIRSNKYIYTCEDQEYDIPFNNLSYSTGDLIHVYRNGVRLFQDLDYSVNASSETITLFVRTEQGERIVFESLGI